MNAFIAFEWYLVHLDDDISLILDLGYWSVFDDNLARPLEHYSFHGVAAHVESN